MHSLNGMDLCLTCIPDLLIYFQKDKRNARLACRVQMSTNEVTYDLQKSFNHWGDFCLFPDSISVRKAQNFFVHNEGGPNRDPIRLEFQVLFLALRGRRGLITVSFWRPRMSSVFSLVGKSTAIFSK